MSKVEITSEGTSKTIIKVDGVEVEGCWNYVLRHDCHSHLVLELDVLATDYTVRADDVKVEEYLCCVACRNRMERDALDFLKRKDDIKVGGTDD